MAVKHLYGRAFVDGEILDGVRVSLKDGVIAEVVQTADVPATAVRTQGLIVPGFIDCHIHGGDGADFMDADDAGIARILSFHARHGTTALAATTLSASPSDLRKAVAAIGRAAKAETGGQICALHLEGPFINPERAGAQDRSSIRPPDVEELGALLGEAPELPWIVTLAPEMPGARALIERFRDRVKLAIGHTAADYHAAMEGLSWGASHFTHLFNAMTGLHHREPGAVGAAMVSPEATVELIADGLHVAPAVLHVAARMMPDRVALVSDAIRACGRPDGVYKLYHHDVTVAGREARLADGTLAGSLLTMCAAVRLMVELAGLPLASVIPLATEVPARILGLAARKGKLERGYDADVVVLDEEFRAERVFVKGRERF
ncbi:MAG TPA: N-acetylglucosamine-6-phosphate deacetylase [Thermoanaerobaculia bacterium]|jgi:N-acetylglucosamine-6-phosphate deacetylase|nr:N-acetylglucosamine-6-phosphate deacetylase [Thermoanaerobaculia bacterium]